MAKGTTITAATYCEILKKKKTRTAIKNRQPSLLQQGIILFHNNAYPHSARVMAELLKKFKWDIFEQHPPLHTLLTWHHLILHYSSL